MTRFGEMPTVAAMVAAARRLSPVSIHTRTPSTSCRWAMAAAESGRGESEMLTSPNRTLVKGKQSRANS